MPPKLSKRDFGNGDQTTLETALDTENISIDSILFPKATVMKLARQILAPEGSESNPMILSKDALTVIQRASVVFVNHIYYHAKANAKKSARKGVNPSDVLVALEKAEFESFIPILEEELENFNMRKKAKKLVKASAKEGEEDDEEEGEDAAEKDATTTTTEDGRKRAKVANGSLKKVTGKKDAPVTIDAEGHEEAEEEEEEQGEEEEDEEVVEDEEEDDELVVDEDEDEEDDGAAPLNASQRLAKEQKELEGQSLDESTVGEEEEEEEED